MGRQEINSTVTSDTVLVMEDLMRIADSLPKYETLKEKFIKKIMPDFKYSDISNIYVILPRSMYDKVPLKEPWILTDEYCDKPIAFDKRLLRNKNEEIFSNTRGSNECQ